MDMRETRRQAIDEVELMLANARLRDELEPYRDESIESSTKRMSLQAENEYLASMLAWERAPALPIGKWFSPELELPMPSSLDRGRAGGVIGLLGASGDLRSEDPNAAVQVILQSNHDHWIQIAQIPLSELKGGWKELSIRTTEPELLAAMPELYALRFQLRAHKPVTGRIYFDDLGFILRAH